jgi:hypothetical protein
MAILKRRTRMLAFRISEEDYERLYSLCTSLGARSVSDLARTAVNRLIGAERGEGDPLVRHIQVLSRTVSQLKATVDELESRLNRHGAGRDAEA